MPDSAGRWSRSAWQATQVRTPDSASCRRCGMSSPHTSHSSALSPDGKTLTDNFTGYHTNGTTTNLHYIYQRIAEPDVADGGSRFAGTWESTTEDLHSTYEMEIKPFQNGGLSFTNVAAQVTQNLQFDGKDYPGTNVPAGYTSSGSRIGDRAVERVDKINGKTLYTQQIEVSGDGKTLTMTVHIPGRDKPNVMVFNRE